MECFSRFFATPANHMFAYRVSYWPAFGLAGLLWASPAAAQSYTLLEAMGSAYTTNPQLEGARSNTRAADEGVAEAKGNWRPKLNASGSYGVQRADVAGLPNTLSKSPVLGHVELSQSVISGG